jgi:hypothetical protein
MSTEILNPSIPKLYALDSILPEHLRENAKFIEFMNAYFKWMQLDAGSPATIINTLNENRDIDLIDENFIKYIEKEIATSTPGNLPNVDKRKLYKQINDIYRSKGSIPSFEALFNLLYGDDIELYYPRVDMLKISDGNWSEEQNRYLNKGGFLSDYNYIQDSFYYQDYSYVIKTRKPYEQWQSAVKKLLHPSGFALFGKIVVVSRADVKRLKSPLAQPGSILDTNANIYPIRPVAIKATTTVVESQSWLQVTYLSIANKFGPSFALLDKIKFLIPQRNSRYQDFSIRDAVNGAAFNILPRSVITIS